MPPPIKEANINITLLLFTIHDSNIPSPGRHGVADKRNFRSSSTRTENHLAQLACDPYFHLVFQHLCG